MTRTIEVDCCVAGGGPAGVMAGLLFARAGCKTLVLEKHADFLRDFRGDTVHPSTLEVMHELGILDGFLQRPHRRVEKLAGVFGGQELYLTDFSSLPTACKFIALMPQWHFLDFLTETASNLPTFDIEMRAQVVDLIEEGGGRITGIRADTEDGPLEVRAKLVIGADGRASIVREKAGLKVKDIGAPIDVLWFKVPRDVGERDEPLVNTGPGHIIITLDRGDYYQCAFIIPKGAIDTVRQKGLDAFKRAAVKTAERLGKHIDDLKSFDDIKLLTVKIDRLEQWSRPGLIMIGDSAHAMSPVGGIGINLAIQDAVAAANLLAEDLRNATLQDADLDKVRKRRLWPTRATQFAQVEAQNNIIKPLLSNPGKMPGPPLPLRIVASIPWLQRKLAGLIGLGVRPKHVTSPEKYKLS
ncbi:MAG: FAD-dependent oxidoreductase [Alphaproteobacteria bacterium]|nr:FAD-dependent oxidoreductase [Alphaproteobacteria bacterium]